MESKNIYIFVNPVGQKIRTSGLTLTQGSENVIIHFISIGRFDAVKATFRSPDGKLSTSYNMVLSGKYDIANLNDSNIEPVLSENADNLWEFTLGIPSRVSSAFMVSTTARLSVSFAAFQYNQRTLILEQVMTANSQIVMNRADITDSLDESYNPSDVENLWKAVNDIVYSVEELDDNKQDIIDATHKLSADLVDDTSSVNKFTNATEKAQIATNTEDIADLNTALSGKQDALSEAQLAAANSGITSTKVSNYDSHISNTSNPHSVTKAQIGLGNVDNTADLDKPISSAVQAALDTKQATLAFDDVPTSGSSNPVKSSGIFNAINNAISTVYRPQGSASTTALNDLSKVSTMNGFVYDVTDSGSLVNSDSNTISVNIGDNVVFLWNNGSWKWDKLAGMVDLSSYYTKAQTNDLLATKQATLVSGTNIKTIATMSVLGSGDITASSLFDKLFDVTEVTI